mgnify:CR=1 FL=1
MVQYLKRNSKFWNKLKEEYADEGAVIGSYSLRHAFAYRGVFLYEMNPDDLSQQMGHDLQTHLKNYRNFHDEKGRKERFKKAKANGVTVEVKQDSKGRNIYIAKGDKANEYQSMFNSIRKRECETFRY